MEGDHLITPEENPRVTRLRNSSWILPGLPWAFGALYILLASIEEPSRTDLLVAGLIALAFGFLCLASNLTSRVLISGDKLDVRDYGVRHAVSIEEITSVYTIPSTFSTVVAFDGQERGRVTIHLGYWQDEPGMLAELGRIVRARSTACSPKAAKLLKVAATDVRDETSPSLVEGALALIWILASTVVPVLVGMLIA